MRLSVTPNLFGKIGAIVTNLVGIRWEKAEPIATKYNKNVWSKSNEWHNFVLSLKVAPRMRERGLSVFFYQKMIICSVK